jgi:archaellum component FlaF (FlaF/FlaG flagellin family)
VETYNKMVATGKIPEAVIILVVTAVCVPYIYGPCLTMANIFLQVENALKEWSSGEYVALQFSDDVASSR